MTIAMRRPKPLAFLRTDTESPIPYRAAEAAWPGPVLAGLLAEVGTTALSAAETESYVAQFPVGPR